MVRTLGVVLTQEQFFCKIALVRIKLHWLQNYLPRGQILTFCFKRLNMLMIHNGNWTEWSAVWAEIIRVISKSNERPARVRVIITSMISDQNCMTRGSITTLLHPFWNHPNTGPGKFKYFIDVSLSWSEIKFIHFLGGINKSFWNKSCKICRMTLFVFHFPAIWSVTLNKP